MNEIPMLDLARLHAPIAEELKAAFADTLQSSRFIGGPAVERFEQELAEHLGVKHVVGLSSGTDALLASMMALGVGPGDEVITTPYTFFATAGCISRLGAKPVFADIEPVCFNIDPSLIEAAITKKTVGIIPVHLFGHAADMKPILDIAGPKELWVLEDAAQAIGAKYRDEPAGGMGAAGAFSFFPAKNLGALGDGGAVTANDEGLAARIRAIRRHGAGAKYSSEVVGGNFRLDALQASFLSIKLPHLEKWEQGRRSAAELYGELLADLEQIALPKELPGCRHVFNQYVIRTKKRDEVQNALKKEGVGCAVYYPIPLHLMGCFNYLGHKNGDMPNSERAAGETLALPIDPLLEEEDQIRISEVIKKALK
jgi:dTDP-4-amino-4,6-dideoxygalactose transaminase